MTHAHGTFCFAELHTSDMGRDARFYGDLFGWTVVEAPNGGGDYSLFQLDGADVAGLRRTHGPRRWVPYVSVAGVDEAATTAHGLGAAIVTAPIDVPGAARIAVLHDPAGGVIGLWEVKGHAGAQVVDRPGSLWWAELLTRDVQVARQFYASLLGWTAVDTLKYGIRYSIFKLGNQAVGGLLPIGSDWGPVGAYWQVLFATADCDATLARAKTLGGSIIFGPNDVPNAGRATIITDPGNATFALMQPKGGS
jgi:hypothetical protein